MSRFIRNDRDMRLAKQEQANPLVRLVVHAVTCMKNKKQMSDALLKGLLNSTIPKFAT